MRENSEKLVNSLAYGIGKLRQTAEHSVHPIYSQVRSVTRTEGPKCLAGVKLGKKESHAQGKIPPWPFLPGENF